MANIKRANTSGITKSGAAISDVPDAPTIGAVTDTAAGGTVTVAYTAAATGGAVTTFTATSTPGSLTGTGASPITVTGLTDGTAYTFKVKGTNSTATGPESSASSSVTPTSFLVGAYDSIATVNVSSATPTITFSSIPATYTHLQLRFIARSSRTQTQGYIMTRFNGDSGTNYSRHTVEGNGAAAESYAEYTVSYGSLYEIPAANATANIFGAGVVDILDYANTNKYKTLRASQGDDRNGGGRIYLYSGLWQNTAAITSIVLTEYNGFNFEQYSSFALYGIKGA